MDINSNSYIKLNILSDKGFNVVDDGLIRINGGVIAFELTQEMIKEIMSKLDENNIYQFTVISGAYSGTFDDIEIKKDESSCEEISGELNYESPTMLTATFKVDKCPKLKWWIILIICLGAVIVVATTLILIIMFNKSCRSRFLPYQNK